MLTRETNAAELVVEARFDGNSELIAELVTANGFKAAYAIKDGAAGNWGWMNSGLPWLLPKKTLSLNLSSFTDAIDDISQHATLQFLYSMTRLNMYGGSDALVLILGITAAAGLGLLAFSEVEPIIQLLISVALVQVISKNLLFAEQIGKTFLPSIVIGKALPETGEASFSITDNTELAAESTPKVNSVPKVEVEESLPGISRSLSPYPFYLDFKPPTSPMPSQPVVTAN
ncbi:thylakoid rhodanese-like protein [Actinidia rufa]|uniref:Thylakoid rhodanese-like protein n=1 Tax=Actinidia rufa TaxID=165716 RepID=A0A7J0F0W3_9ERIC|nr:thylakoid rhodanese-like protein [Actinidia rufa]